LPVFTHVATGHRVQKGKDIRLEGEITSSGPFLHTTASHI